MVLPLLIIGGVTALATGALAYWQRQRTLTEIEKTKQELNETEQLRIDADRQKSLVQASSEKLIALSPSSVDDFILLAQKSAPAILIVAGLAVLAIFVLKK